MAKYTLMKHQKQAVKFLEDKRGVGALLMEPGTGKTGSTLAWLDKLADRRGEVRVLVVAPLTAADTWVLQVPLFMDSVVKARMMQGATTKIMAQVAQARDWDNVPDTPVMEDHKGEGARVLQGNKVTILSVSAGAVSSYCKNAPATVQMLRAIRKYQPHVVVVDESHIIKSATANISTAMYQIGQLAPHRIILTGTVAPHSPLDVYGQWRFLAPWTFSRFYGDPMTKTPDTMTVAQRRDITPWTWKQFLGKYATQGGFKGKGIGDFINQTDLNNRVAERSLVVLKKDALDLPPTTDIDIHVTLTPKERKAYVEMASKLATEMASGELISAPNALAKIMKLRQIASGFVKDTETGEVHVVGRSLQKAVAEVVNTQLAGENRIVVFAYFKAECEALQKALAQKGRTVEVITGATKPADRLAIRKRFLDVSGNPEPVVLVAQQRTMSVSVNELVSAQHAVYASMSERRDDWVQSRGRLDRQGQTAPVTYWNVYVPNTVGAVMLNTHKMRGDLEKGLLDHIRSYAK